MKRIIPNKELEKYIKATGWKPKEDKSENKKLLCQSLAQTVLHGFVVRA